MIRSSHLHKMFKHSLNQSEANIHLLVTNKRPEIWPLSSSYPWLRLALFSHKNTRVSALLFRFSQGRAATESPSLVSPLWLRSFSLPLSSCQLQLSLSRNDPRMLNKQYFSDCQAPTQYQSRCPNVHSKSIELNSKLQKIIEVREAFRKKKKV